MREVKKCKCGGQVSENQIKCAECKKLIDKQSYLNKVKKQKAALLKKCKCGHSAYFLIDRPISDISLKELKTAPTLCISCLLEFNTL